MPEPYRARLSQAKPSQTKPSRAKPFASTPFVASASSSQHNLLWFCIYFASQACLRLCLLQPAASSISPVLLLGAATFQLTKPTRLPTWLSSRLVLCLALPGTSVSGWNCSPRCCSVRLLVLVLCAAFAPCLQSLQRRGRPCGDSDPKLQLSRWEAADGCSWRCSRFSVQNFLFLALLHWVLPVF